MYKKDNFIICITSILMVIISVRFRFYFFTTKNYDPANVITFLSIILGFQTGAFALLFSSTTVRDLYKIKDLENNKITLKHRLKNYYKASFIVSILSILFLILFDTSNALIVKNIFSNYFVCAIPCIIFMNTFILFKTNSLLYKIFIKDASK